MKEKMYVISVSKEVLDVIDQYRAENRIYTRVAATDELLKLGLAEANKKKSFFRRLFKL